MESRKLVFFRSHLPPAPDPAAAEGQATEPAADKPAQPLAGVPAKILPEIEPNAGIAEDRPRRVTRCIPLAKLALTDIERRKIDRYLDVTKSAFLFGGRVLLVEGVAEALLLPVIAKKYVLKDDVEKLRLFRSAVFVPIDGVDFDPYAKLLLTAYADVRIADRLVVLTDGDAGKVEIGEETPGAGRKRRLTALAKDLGAEALLDVIVNDDSVESELVKAGNAATMKAAYVSLHPQSGAKWDAAVSQTGGAQAAALQALYETTRKGDFAQVLADAINQGAAFAVPGYLEEAFEALVV